MTLRRTRVMIIDDQPEIHRDVGAIILSSIDCDIVAASSWAEAMSALEAAPPDLILLDLMMSGMDGFDFCARLKTMEQTKDIPVIFLAVKADSADIVRGFEAGAADYVTKPFNASELLARVHAQLLVKTAHDSITALAIERGELIHILAHDLKNPIGGVESALEIIKDSPGMLDKLLPVMISSLSQALNLIDLVKDFGAIESGRTIVTLAPVSVSESLRHVQHMLAKQFTTKKVVLVIDGPEDVRVMVDQVTFINTVLNNLVTNAIKFSYPGSEISVRFGVDGGKVWLTVTDHGIGIGESILQNIFSVTKSASRPGTDGELGTGYGMPLVKKFVEAYGGTIGITSCESAAGTGSHGTTVRLTLKTAT